MSFWKELFKDKEKGSDAPLISEASTVEVATEDYVPNPIRLTVVSLPIDMPEELAIALISVFESGVVKVGGFGGVGRADPAVVDTPLVPITYYKTHRPYVAIREIKGKIYEKTLNAVIEKYIDNRSLSTISHIGGIGLFAYEYEEDSGDIIDAWWLPSMFYGRSEVDGRQDARLIYLDIFGEVKGGDAIVRIAQDYHEHRTIRADLGTVLSQVL